MSTLNKTPKGTIGAFRWDNGIAMGLHGKGNCISLEYNKESDKLELLIVDEEIEKQNIIIKHVNKDWQVTNNDK